MSALYNLTLQEVHNLLRSREASSVEITEACLERITQVESKINAFVTVTGDLALEQARKVDDNRSYDEGSLLAGIPFQSKDVICTRGIRTTCSSRMLENFVPPYDATVMEKLYANNGVLLGKGNMDEFAMGSSTEHSAFFPTRNPWDTSRVPGGSSGGSAAAVAADEAFYALGSDTGGSIRQPASLCGIVALKPTYGLVSRYGLIAFASSLDQIGPMTKSVADSALVLNAVAGYDPRDSTSINTPIPDYSKSLTGEAKGMRVGVPREFFEEGTQPGVLEALKTALNVIEGLGVSVEETTLPSTKYATACYHIIAPSECSANLARYDGVKFGHSNDEVATMWDAMERTRQEGFGPEVKRRIMLGAYALSSGYYDAYYLKAQKVRTLISRELDEAFQKYDVLVTPSSPTVAFGLGEKTANPLEMYLSDICNISANMAGTPALSVPCGFSDGLPVGMQLMGPALSEPALIRLGYAYEQSCSWRLSRPDI